VDDRRVKIKIGIFVLVGVALLSLFIVLLGNVALYGGQPLVLYAQDSAGLKERAPVRILGINAGIVRTVALLREDIPIVDGRPYPIRIDISVNDEELALLRSDARFSLKPSSLLGEKIVAIDPGLPLKPALEWQKPIYVVPAAGMDQAMVAATRLAGTIEDFLAKLDVVEKASDLVERVDASVVSLTQKAEKSFAEVDATLKITREKLQAVEIPHIEQARVDRLLTRLESILVSADREIPALSGEARALLGDARGMTEELRALSARLGASAEGSMSRVAELLMKLDEGDGLLAMLLKDREIYYDLKELVRDLRKHPWKVLWKD
jgi:phospholipid/cholesterol/gamma-HCH transport system substrate-binding protein